VVAVAATSVETGRAVESPGGTLPCKGDGAVATGALADAGFTAIGTTADAQSLGICEPSAENELAAVGTPGRLVTVATGLASGAIGCGGGVGCVNWIVSATEVESEEPAATTGAAAALEAAWAGVAGCSVVGVVAAARAAGSACAEATACAGVGTAAVAAA
jgi:uncharacterized membrane protein YfcA